MSMSADLILLICVIVVDVFLVLETLFFIVRRNASNNLIRLAFQNDEEGFEAACSSFGAKTLSAFDKKLIRFNVAEIKKPKATSIPNLLIRPENKIKHILTYQ